MTYISALLCCITICTPVLASKTLTVGNAIGRPDQIVEIPIIIDNSTGIGGMAFTLLFNSEVFEFQDIKLNEKVISDGSDYVVNGTDPVEYTGYTESDVQNTIFYQFNDEIDGKVIISVAQAEALSTETTGITFFSARFLIKQGDGNYPINVNKTIIKDIPAGYNTPSALPVLIGMPSETENSEGFYTTPTFATTLIPGSVNVLAPGYTIEGTVSYQGSLLPANGSTLVLKKLAESGLYLYDEQSTVVDGSFYFYNKPNGAYKVSIYPHDPNYFNYSDIHTLNGENLIISEITLKTATPISGIITALVNGEQLQGFAVKILDNNQNLVGVYQVDENGQFETIPLPGTAADYGIYTVYGNIEELIDIDSGTIDWTPTLYSVSGSISGLDESMSSLIVHVGSQTGKLQRYQSIANDNATINYQISNLVPADDYIVSVITLVNPVTYYNQVMDITLATPVQVDNTTVSDNMTVIDINFSFSSVEKATISGRVIDNGTTRTVSGVIIYAMETNNYGMISDVTDTNGNYSLTVVPGSYELFADNGQKIFFYSGDDTEATQNNSDATAITVENEDVIENININITECDCFLQGTITYGRENGPPMEGVMITAVSDTGFALDFTAQDGSYFLNGLCNGSYQVEMNSLTIEHALQFEEIDMDGDNCLNAQVDFVINQYNTLTGIVTDGINTVSDAVLYLIDDDTSEMVGFRMYFTDSEGEYCIGDIRSGIYTLYVSHRDYENSVVKNIEISGDTTLDDITLSKGTYIYGTIQDGEFDAISDAVVIAVAEGEDPSYAVSNSSGDYEIYGLNQTLDYLITASKLGYQKEVETSISPASEGTEVNFILFPLTQFFSLSGTVISECIPVSPVENIKVVASFSPSDDQKDFFQVTHTDSNGDYTFTNLPFDTGYTLVVVPPGDMNVEIITDIIEVIDTEVVLGDVTLPCGDAVSGLISTSVEADIIYVIIYDSSNNYIGYTLAAEDGTYSVEAPSSGSYKVVAVAQGNITTWYTSDGAGTDSIDNASVFSPGIGINISMETSP